VLLQVTEKMGFGNGSWIRYYLISFGTGQLLLISLQLTGSLDWSWWRVFSPSFIMLGFWLFIIALALVITFFGQGVEEMKGHKHVWQFVAENGANCPVVAFICECGKFKTVKRK